jgi:hypothetical protein
MRIFSLKTCFAGPCFPLCCLCVSSVLPLCFLRALCG